MVNHSLDCITPRKLFLNFKAHLFENDDSQFQQQIGLGDTNQIEILKINWTYKLFLDLGVKESM